MISSCQLFPNGKDAIYLEKLCNHSLLYNAHCRGCVFQFHVLSFCTFLASQLTGESVDQTRNLIVNFECCQCPK